MPHFTVVPVKDQAQASYDSLEGINWVDYRDAGQDCLEPQDTLTYDGKSVSLIFFSSFYGIWDAKSLIYQRIP